MQKDKIILSFCIPTYNRALRVYELVQNLLSYPNSNIEVVVLDNFSTPDAGGDSGGGWQMGGEGGGDLGRELGGYR
jgi:hypothetical protein